MLKDAYDNPVDTGTNNYEDKTVLYNWVIGEIEKEIVQIKKFMARFSEPTDLNNGKYKFIADLNNMSAEDVNVLISFGRKMERYAQMLEKHAKDMKRQKGGQPEQNGQAPRRNIFDKLFNR